MKRWIATVALIILVLPFGAHASCDAPQSVCKAADNVVRISAFDPIGSAVILEDGLLITNRHVVADQDDVTVILPSGETREADVIPTTFSGDLVLLRAPDIRPAQTWDLGDVASAQDLYVIGFDIGRDAVRVYPPGRQITPLADTSLARIHHDARSLPGNSGGALVDGDGRLIGIVTSGGEGRNEALPVRLLDELRATSDPSHVEASRARGQAYRYCYQSMQDAEAIPRRLASEDAAVLKRDCLATGNRQMIDLAAQALGRKLNLDEAVELSKAALAIDPNAPNSLVSMIVSLHIARRFEEEMPYLERAMELLPGDPQILRFALQAGILGGNQDMADRAMQAIEQYLPQMAPAARAFYENPPAR